MSSRWDSFRLFRFSITTQLLLWFLLISLIPCGVLTGVISYLSTQSLKKTVRLGLLAVADAKTTQLEIYVRERRADLNVAGRSPTLVNALQELSVIRRKEPLDSPAYLEVARKVRPFVAHFAESFGYTNYYIFDAEGTVLFRLKPTLDMGSNLLSGPLKKSELAEVFDRIRTLLQVEISDYQVYSGQTEPAAFIAGPVFNLQGRVIGFVALELANSQVFRVFNDYNGLGETGEAVVAARASLTPDLPRGRGLSGEEGEAVVTTRAGQTFTLVAPPRHDPSMVTTFQGRIGDGKAIPMQRAVQGQRGYGESIDYRGEPVIAAWSYLPSFRWGMVVKQDVAEAFALINHQKQAITLLFVVTILLVTAVALWLAKTITQPIREAATVTNRVASGDLTVTCEGKAPGEAGLLLQAVRKMIQDLRSLIGKIQRSSITLLSTATEISAASRQQEQSVYDYSASTNQAAAAVNEISATSQELLKTMNEVNQVVNQTSRMATTGQQSLAGMDQTMRQLAESTGSIGSKLSVISERAANINLVVTTITKVADQTNLLSINAAIEAEKAGEYGLGFLVVAREIRRLADMTAVSTLDIERMVKEMQYSVSAGVLAMDKFSEQVRKVVGEVAQIGGQLGQIIAGVQGLHQRFDQVTEGMRVQSQGADQIREAMSRVSEAANQTSLSIREFNKATDRLREAVGGLKEEVSGFILVAAEPSPAALPRPATTF
jgi:methyl-accepting chemotaxis protein WspA